MKKALLFLALTALAAGIFIKDSFAGAPFVNLEGVGGVAFNPLAYLADSDEKSGHLKIADTDVLGLPRFGAWYINLDEVNVDWTAIGVADTILKKVEISYGYESVNQENAAAKHKNNIGAKWLVLPENAFDSPFLPALSIGAIYKHTSNAGAGVDASGVDYYLVATKLITLLPRPLLLSGGVLSTTGKATGVFGYDEDRSTTGFANIDIILPLNCIAGFEYKQGARYSDWKDADDWDAHLAWSPNDKLTLALAYVNAGDAKGSKRTGLGDGVVLSAQYAF